MAANKSSRLGVVFPVGLPLLVLACFFPCSSCHCDVGVSKNTDEHDGEAGAASEGIKGMFVFGSSLVDNGNNNFLPDSLAKADYLPYGIDFPIGPSGRFTNGKNVIDLFGDHLKLPSFVPAFADPNTKGTKILHGVNFASGASGILDDTGSLAGHVINLNQQIRNFEEVTLPELEAELGRCTTSQSLEDYLFVVGTGGNDYSFNYFLTTSSRNVTLETFTANLTASLSTQLKKLHSLGARKFVLMSINPLGCSPVVRMSRPTHNGCMQKLNRAAHLFNTHLKSLVDGMRVQMPGSSLVFVNSYKIIRDIIKNPISKGFKDASTTCCEVASINEGGNGILCKKEGKCAETEAVLCSLMACIQRKL